MQTVLKQLGQTLEYKGESQYAQAGAFAATAAPQLGQLKVVILGVSCFSMCSFIVL